MDFKRLFHVLVIGGSVLGCESARSDSLGASEPDSATGTEADANAVGDDASPGPDGGAVETGTPEAGSTEAVPPAPCFCSPTQCCDQHADGDATVKAGVFCCWATSC